MDREEVQRARTSVLLNLFEKQKRYFEEHPGAVVRCGSSGNCIRVVLCHDGVEHVGKSASYEDALGLALESVMLTEYLATAAE